MTSEIKEKLISWCKIEKYNQGNDYSAWVTKKGKYAVSYSNDYPMQHGSEKTFILTDEEFEYAMNRPLTEIELMGEFWHSKTMEERQKLCDKYFTSKFARCLWDYELILIYKSETIIDKVAGC